MTPTLAAGILALAWRSQKPPPPAPDDGLPDLTRPEEQILGRVARGLTNREIAKALQVGETTVKHYMTTIMHKLQVRNRVEAALVFKEASGKGARSGNGMASPVRPRRQSHLPRERV